MVCRSPARGDALCAGSLTAHDAELDAGLHHIEAPARADAMTRLQGDAGVSPSREASLKSGREAARSLPREGVPRVAVHELGDHLLRDAGVSHGRHELAGHGAVVLRQLTDTGPYAIEPLDLEAGRLARSEPARVGADDDPVLIAGVDELADPVDAPPRSTSTSRRSSHIAPSRLRAGLNTYPSHEWRASSVSGSAPNVRLSACAECRPAPFVASATCTRCYRPCLPRAASRSLHAADGTVRRQTVWISDPCGGKDRQGRRKTDGDVHHPGQAHRRGSP